MGFWDGLAEFGRGMAEKTQKLMAEMEKYKAEYSRLSDRELFEEGKRQKHGAPNMAIRQLLKERGWYYNSDENKWQKR